MDQRLVEQQTWYFRECLTRVGCYGGEREGEREGERGREGGCEIVAGGISVWLLGWVDWVGWFGVGWFCHVCIYVSIYPSLSVLVCSALFWSALFCSLLFYCQVRTFVENEIRFDGGGGDDGIVGLLLLADTVCQQR